MDTVDAPVLMEIVRDRTAKWGYTWNAVPVIEVDDYWKAILYLPNIEKARIDNKCDTYIVLLDNDEDKAIMFDWDETLDGWRLRNKLVVSANDGVVTNDCVNCGKDVDHIVNKALTKLRCIKCSSIVDV